MASSDFSVVKRDSKIHEEKVAIFSCNSEVSALNFRWYLIENWAALSQGMDNCTMLFIAGVHGSAEGKLGEKVGSVKTMKNQVRYLLIFYISDLELNICSFVSV